MNRTGSFKETVKAVERRFPAETSEPDSENPDLSFLPDKNRILPASKKRKHEDGFDSRGRAIVENVTRLKDFLGENRNAYLDVMNNECQAHAITDIERDKIDAGAQKFMKTIKGLLSRFKLDIKDKVKGMKGQRIKHLEAVTDILDHYLRAVCEIHSRQKAIRVEKELEMQRFSRLEVKARTTTTTTTKSASEAEATGSEGDDEGSPNRSQTRRKRRRSNARTTPVPPSSGRYLYSSDDDNDPNPQEMFSPEEVQILEQENAELYEDLMTMKDSVRQIENKVVKIAELQDVFTSKVLQQKDDIDVIAGHAVASTENIKDGNEELRKAIQRNASIRVYILFFLLVMSFSLLFLDWYNE